MGTLNGAWWLSFSQPTQFHCLTIVIICDRCHVKTYKSLLVYSAEPNCGGCSRISHKCYSTKASIPTYIHTIF